MGIRLLVVFPNNIILVVIWEEEKIIRELVT